MPYEKSEKIRNDHCERLRILEIAIQQSTDRLEQVIAIREPPLTHCVNLQIEVKQHIETLKNAIKKSHEIAIKEY